MGERVFEIHLYKAVCHIHLWGTSEQVFNCAAVQVLMHQIGAAA